MEPIWKFQHLDVARCFPTEDETWWRYEPLVPAPGRHGVLASDVLASGPIAAPSQINACAAGVLYMCVLNLPLFQCDDTHQQHVRDVRIRATDKQHYFPSQDHQQLLDNLVISLKVHEEFITKRLVENLAEMDRYAAMLTELHRRRKTTLRWHTTRVPGRKTTRRWSARLPPAYRFRPHELYLSLLQVENFNLSWPLQYATQMSKQTWTRHLIEDVYDIFVQYGPVLTHTRPQYSHAALYAAIYVLLAAFGLEKPEDAQRGPDRVEYVVTQYRRRKKSSLPLG